MTTTRGEPAVDADAPAEPVLWDRAAGGDHEAFTEVFHRHFDAVWAHAYRLTGSRAAAEDLTASTFLTAWRRRADVRITRETARPWLMAVTTNLSRTAWRSGARQDRAVKRLGPPPDTADHSDAVAGSVDDTLRLRRVLAAVEQLSPALREAVGLCLIGDLSTADAARALGVTEVTVRSRISRARSALRSLLGEDL